MHVKIVVNLTHLECKGHFLEEFRSKLDSKMPNSGHEFPGFNNLFLYHTSQSYVPEYRILSLTNVYNNRPFPKSQMLVIFHVSFYFKSVHRDKLGILSTFPQPFHSRHPLYLVLHFVFAMRMWFTFVNKSNTIVWHTLGRVVQSLIKLIQG